MRTRLHDFLAARDIRVLCHFTPADNLTSIFEHGLLPRNILDEQGLDYLYTDDHRFDQAPAAISLSVESYNYPMLRRKMIEAPGIKWAVLVIDAGILAGATARFCPRNAAKSEMKWGLRQSLRHFEEMFEDSQRLGILRVPSAREHIGLPSYIPTDPQAEIQFFGRIDPVHIRGALCFDERLETALLAYFDSLQDRERSVGVMPFMANWVHIYGGFGALYDLDEAEIIRPASR